MKRTVLPLFAALAVASASLVPAAAAQQQAASADVPHVLVFSGTFGFRHSSIPESHKVLRQLAAESGAFTVEVTEKPEDFTAAKLAQTDVMLWANTTGETPFTAAQKTLIEQWWSCGGGWAGLHAAADTNYQWPAYQELVGAAFKSHPHNGGTFRALGAVGAVLDEATVKVEAPDHPITQAWKGQSTFRMAEEYYKFRTDPRKNPEVTPLLALDETTTYPHVQAGNDAYYDDQPVEWVKSFRGKNRVWYTSLGHYNETYNRADWKTHAVAALRWVSEVRPDATCLEAAGIR